MTIGPITAVGQGAPQLAKPELTETPGTPDHDHDADSSAAPAPKAPAPGGATAPGTLDVRA